MTPSRAGKVRKACPAKQVGLRELAQYLKLSQATVSVVINDSPAAKAIPKQTKERVLQAARKLQYRANFFARSLSLRRGCMVGVVVPELSEGYVASIMRGIESQLLAEGYCYFVASHQGQPDRIQQYPRMLIDRGVEGVIFVNTPVVQELTVPVVAISGHQRVPGVTNIAVDNAQATFAALEHLVRLGHRRIAFFKGHRGSLDTDHRWRGILSAASRLGIEVCSELTAQLQEEVPHPGPSVPGEGYGSAKKLLETGQFTALFAFNDISAIGAIRALRDAGLRVPEEVSVIGFDDIQAAEYLTPRLTTVRQPLQQMGEIAATQLLLRIANPRKKVPHRTLLAPQLMVRESTGPAPATPHLPWISKQLSAASPP
ncbi:putative Transcriptional regulator [Candidatus Sulfotelmatobacter kueseliae]|uniref:Putative Transcriptional regulator n=1 Tax=Candidatus Sulfotelmatobacter kueseliae TaxID=2042962 RepID=A0A2U3KQC2_9BACT|nr:putative Transcriptional regulator [Candidatus Sulfotelmatobacter kueseliae]